MLTKQQLAETTVDILAALAWIEAAKPCLEAQ